MSALHDDELSVDLLLVRRLIGSAMPEFSDASVRPVDTPGSSNALFRIGTDLVAHFPRQPGGSESIEKEARWLPHVAAALTTPTPTIVGVGEPAFGYPERWLISRWVEGQVPRVPWSTASGSSEAVAADLARFIAELGEVSIPLEAQADPRLSSYRGGRLVDHVEDFEQLVDTCRGIPDLDLDLDRAHEVWTDAVAAERSVPACVGWYHGDLLAENLLVRDNRLAAVIDFGGLSIGDPTVDLIVAWEVLDPSGRATLRTALGVDDAVWQKSMGWALLIALITFPYYWETMPTRCADRRFMARAVLAEA